MCQIMPFFFHHAINIKPLRRKICKNFPESWESCPCSSYGLIEQNFPNPFNGITKINFSLSKRTAIKLVVLDLAGHQVDQLIAATMDPGRYCYLWRPSSELPSGFYLFRLSTPDESGEKCGLLLK